jgi:hypothetical protein
MAGYKVHLQWVAWVMALVVLIGWQTPTYAEVPPTEGPALSEPLWTIGEVGDHAGPAGILITDIEQDGITETITCTANSPYIYRALAQSPTAYYLFWYGERVGCSALALADTDGDTIPELFVGSHTPMVYRYHYNTVTHHYGRTTHLALPGTEDVKGLAAGDVDGDGRTELIITRASSTAIYDAHTLILEWEATGLGGTGVKIGNVDGDSAIEIIVNGPTGYTLSAATQSAEQTKVGGWGRVMDVGDTNHDGRADIAYVRGATVATSVVGVDTVTEAGFQSLWEIGAGYGEWVTIGEVDGSSAGAEVVVGGDGSGDAIATRNGTNGTLLWNIPNPGSGVQGMGIGDSDNDGVADIWWGSGQTSASGDHLLVANSATRTLVWRNRDYEGPFFTAAGDIDTDGTVELVAVSTTMNDGNLGGVYLAYDGITFREEMTRTTQVNPTAFILAQMDDDAGLELVIGGRFHGATNGYIEVIDGNTRQTQWTRSGVGNGDIVALKAANVDMDAREELFIAAPNRRVYVHDGASNTTEWEGGPYSTPIVDLEIADADNDGILELGVLTQDNFYLYSTQSWVLETTIPINQAGYIGSQVAAGNHDGSDTGEWIIAGVKVFTESIPVAGVPYETRLQVLNGSTYSQTWESLLPGVTVVEMLTQIGSESTAGQLYLGGYQQVSAEAEQPTYLSIADYDDTGATPRYINEAYWGDLYSMTFTDVDTNGIREWFIGTLSLYQLRSTEPIILPTAVTVTMLKAKSTLPDFPMLPLFALLGIGIIPVIRRVWR